MGTIDYKLLTKDYNNVRKNDIIIEKQGFKMASTDYKMETKDY